MVYGTYNYSYWGFTMVYDVYGTYNYSFYNIVFYKPTNIQSLWFMILITIAGWWYTYPLKNMSPSIGMMTFPIYGKITHAPNHQPDNYSCWGL